MSRIFSALSGRARMVQWRVLKQSSAPLNYPFDANSMARFTQRLAWQTRQRASSGQRQRFSAG
jgi:hypothetical protein